MSDTLYPLRVITNGDMTADIVSDPVYPTNFSGFSYSVWWTGSTPVGVASIQVTNDPDLGDAAWSDFATAAVSGNTGNGFFNIQTIVAYAVRLKYTFTSGSGFLQAEVNAKTV